MAVTNPIEADLKTASLARDHAQAVRSYHRRRTDKGSKQREVDLKEATERIRRTMKPLRSFLGKAPYQTQSTTHLELLERVRELSSDLQSERRKLWKMMQHEPKPVKENINADE